MDTLTPAITAADLSPQQRTILIRYVRGETIEHISRQVGVGEMVVLSVIANIAEYNKQFAWELIRRFADAAIGGRRVQPRPYTPPPVAPGVPFSSFTPNMRDIREAAEAAARLAPAFEPEPSAELPPEPDVVEQIIARATGKAVCRVCGRAARLRKDGRVDNHRDSSATWCDGKGRMPKADVA